MKRKLGVIFIILVVAACHRKDRTEEMTRLMGKWYQKTVSFPPNTVLLNRANISHITTDKIELDGSSKYIIHFFTADCDKCIEEIKVAQRFIESHNELPVKYIFIASGPTDVYVAEAIQKVNFRYPVFYEREYFSFKHLNNFPEEDKMYNTMLTDRYGKLLFFGGFFTNKRAQELLIDICDAEKN